MLGCRGRVMHRRGLPVYGLRLLICRLRLLVSRLGLLGGNTLLALEFLQHFAAVARLGLPQQSRHGVFVQTCQLLPGQLHVLGVHGGIQLLLQPCIRAEHPAPPGVHGGPGCDDPDQIFLLLRRVLGLLELLTARSVAVSEEWAWLMAQPAGRVAS